MNLLFKKIFKYLLPIAAGGIIGYSYYYFIGCSGTCAIQSNPYLSTIYGMAAGAIFIFPSKEKTESLK